MAEIDSMIERVTWYLESKKVSICPPASQNAIDETENSLGFPLPPLLAALYRNVGNGWSAPGYGFIGVAGGRVSDLGGLAATYREVQRGAEYSNIKWPEGLLPFCEWGCNIFSCVACHNALAPIHRSEECEEFAEGYTLEDFVTMWINDVSLLDSVPDARVMVQIVNPFTREKTPVPGRRKPKR